MDVAQDNKDTLEKDGVASTPCIPIYMYISGQSRWTRQTQKEVGLSPRPQPKAAQCLVSRIHMYLVLSP
jgi:hypothetical protein